MSEQLNTPSWPDDPGAGLRITRESLAAFTFALCGSMGQAPDEFEKRIGLWFLVQQCHEGIFEIPGIPEKSRDGTMNEAWALLIAATLAGLAHARLGGGPQSKEVMVEQSMNLWHFCVKAIRTITVEGHYAQAVAAARAQVFFDPRLDIENWPRDANGARYQPDISDILLCLRKVWARDRRRRLRRERKKRKKGDK